MLPADPYVSDEGVRLVWLWIGYRSVRQGELIQSNHVINHGNFLAHKRKHCPMRVGPLVFLMAP
jgi:hypothetical protein